MSYFSATIIQQKLERFDEAEASYRAALDWVDVPDAGQMCRLATGYAAICADLAGRATHLSEQERATRTRRHAEAAIALLHSAVDAGFRNAADLEQAPAFASIRSRPDFQKLLATMKQKQQ
jgi:hypothetical protein